MSDDTDLPDGLNIERPQVNLEWPMMWCYRHSKPFKPEWPKGTGVGMAALFQKASAMPAVQEAASHDAHQLSQALERFAPICCFVSRSDLLEVYQAAGVMPAP